MTQRSTPILGTFALSLAACMCCPPTADVHRAPPTIVPVDKQQIWVADDAILVARHAGSLSIMHDDTNAVWKPGEPLRLFGLPGETISFQVVVTAGPDAIRDATVDVPSLSGPVTLQNDEPADGVLFQPIERFVVHELQMERRSGGKTPGESLGWAANALPPDPSRGGTIADPLIPLSPARQIPPWANYPMRIAPGQHGVVWVDITLPTQDFPAGTYTATIDVRSHNNTLASIPIVLDVGPTPLPFAAVATMVYFEPNRAVLDRTGSPQAVNHFFQLMHRHHLSTVFPLTSAADVDSFQDALTGRIHTPEHGYRGPGEGRATDVVVLGAYGGYGDASSDKLPTILETLRALDALGIRDIPGTQDVFLYAIDEQCDSPVGPAWRKLLNESNAPLLASLRVGHTCSEPPEEQGVDVVMVLASAYKPIDRPSLDRHGKHVWIYNGVLPQTGSFLTDAWHNSLRANGWIQQKYGVERWFYWESTFWNDSNRGGLGPYDPLHTAETFHNAQGDHAMGDGVLVYPGKQSVQGFHSLEFDGVIPSIRLKQWRRGIQDAGYIQLARKVDPRATDEIVSGMIPSAFGKTRSGVPSWPTRGDAWTQARRALFEIICRK